MATDRRPRPKATNCGTAERLHIWAAAEPAFILRALGSALSKIPRDWLPPLLR